MNSINPITTNYDLVEEKKLNLNNRYLNILKKYKIYFEKYINQILDLKKYDNLLINSEYNYVQIADDKKEYYQKVNTLDLKYIYIRNNLNIEVLSLEQLNIIEKSNNEEELLNIVKDTYLDVIKVTCLNGKKMSESFNIQYINGFNNKNTIFSNKSLIIFIRDNSGNANKELLVKRYNYINNLIELMKKDFENKLECNIEICHLLN